MTLHLTDGDLAKLRQAIGNPIHGEWMIKLSSLDRILHLAGQNLPAATVDHVRRQAEEMHQIDEIFLEDLEPLLVPIWEDLTEEEIHQILIDAFETFDVNRQGSIPRKELMEILSHYGDMPLTSEDYQLMFSLVESSTNFDYREFVKKISVLNNDRSVKKKKKKKKKKKTKRSSR